jgi:3-hydroxyacyl-[acyl-carrier-protein] dehydratase
MTLKDTFFTIEKQDSAEGKACFRIKWNAESFIYKAHFPDNPVTPGVCLIQTAVELFGVLKGAQGAYIVENCAHVAKNCAYIVESCAHIDENCTGKGAGFGIKTLKNVKFIAPINPLEFPETDFLLEFSENENLWQVKALVKENETVFAKMSMILK